MNLNTIRKVTIQGEGPGLDAVTGQLNKVAAAQDRVSSAGKTNATVTDMVTKRQLSVADAYRRQTMMLDGAAKAEAEFAKQARIADQALRQQKIGVEEWGQRMDLLRRRYQETGNATKALTSATGALSQGVNLARNAVGAFGVSLGAAALIQYGKQVFNTTAGLQEQTDQILGSGGNVEALQALRGIWLASGISAADGDKMLQRLTRTLGEAAEGSKQAQDAFKQLQLGSAQLAGKSADAALPLIATKLREIQDETKRATIETDLFGKSGQQLESALRELDAPIETLIQRAKELGIVIDAEEIRKADEAADQLALSMMKVSVAIAPIVTQWGNAFSEMAKDVGGTTAAVEALLKKLAVAGGILGGISVGSRVGGVPGALIGGAVGGVGTYAYMYQQDLRSSTIDQLNRQLQNNRLSPSERADLIARRDRQLADYNSNVGFRGLIARPGANDNAPPASNDNAPGWKPTKEDLANAEKLRQTFASFILQQEESARLAGQSNAQRASEAAVIQAAQVAQVEADKDHNVAQKDLIKSYAEAAAYLGESRTETIKRIEAQKLSGPMERELSDQIKIGAAALKAGTDERELAVEFAEREIALGRELTDQERDRLRLRQQQRDELRINDTIEGLREEVQLSGLSADERERQAAYLRAMHDSHGALRADQAAEIDHLIRARQETERWRQVVDGIAGGFQDFFANVLSTGKANFADLWDTIKSQFIQMLAYMASQALINPIIIPMVQGLAGSLGMGGGTDLLGLLANGASLGSSTGMFGTGGLSSMLGLGGSGGLLGGIGTSITSGMNWLGGALGFATPSAIPSAAGLSGAFGGISTTSIPTSLGAQTGSLFGATTFGSFLGGAGLGSLASSLIFGNKNSAGIGGMGGAALGAAIGSIVPGIGTLIGGLAGGLLGGGLGSMTGTSNQGAIANFSDASGLSSYLFKQGGGNNGQLSMQATNAISQAIKQLQGVGVNVGLGNISGISIGSDKSYIYDYAGGKQKLAGGDVQGVVEGVLARILPGASGTTSEAQAILAKYGSINSGNLQQVIQDLGAAAEFAKALSNLDVNQGGLTEKERALKAINDQIDQMAQRAMELGLSTAGLEDARSKAIQQVNDQYAAQEAALAAQAAAQKVAAAQQAADFDEQTRIAMLGYSDALAQALAIEDRAAKQRITQAEQYGANVAAVEQYNAAARLKIVEEFAAQEANLRAAAEAERQARLQLVADFNEEIRIATLGFTDAMAQALAMEDAAEKARLEKAREYGADIAAVEKLNALSRQKILDDFAAQGVAARSKALADAQGEADRESAAAAAAVESARNVLVESYRREQAAIQDSIGKYQGLALSLRDYLGQLTGSSDNPMAQLGIARANFGATAALAQTGDIGAMQRLQQLGQDLISASRVGSQSLMEYSRDRAMVIAAIGNAANVADVRADAATQQLEALNASVEGIIEVRDAVLSVSDAIAAFKKELAAEAKKNAENTARIKELLERVTEDGDALRTAAT